MKRYGQLWNRFISWDNLVLAARKAHRGKRDRVSVQRFNFDLERQLLRLQTELSEQTYCPGAFQTHWINRPKRRMISVAPYRDRVVHHALMNILEPILERHFHPHNFACQKGKGTHAASDRLQKLMKKHPYALQCDIQKFFPSIDHAVMRDTFRRLIKDKDVLWLMDLIVDSSNDQPGGPQWFTGDDLLTPAQRRKGLPIGNLTSQWFANWYLNALDHFVTSGLGTGSYVRYCDDFVLLGRSRTQLKERLEEIIIFLESHRLKLHPNKLHIRPVRSGLTFVGYRIWPSYRILRKTNIREFRRRVTKMKKQYRRGLLDWPDIRIRLDSWIAHAHQADSRKLINRLSQEWLFTRDRVADLSRASRGLLEQQYNQPPVGAAEQQYSVQSQQQLRIPHCPALSEDKNFLTRNHKIYGPCERGFESPDPVPEPDGFINSRPNFRNRADRTGRAMLDGPVCLAA